jgi:toxin ParE1/3/4
LRNLESYLSNRFYPKPSAEFIDRIAEECQSLGSAPFRGLTHDRLLPGLRSIGFEGRVEILFKISPDEVVILGVYYRGQRPEPGDLT